MKFALAPFLAAALSSHSSSCVAAFQFHSWSSRPGALRTRRPRGAVACALPSPRHSRRQTSSLPMAESLAEVDPLVASPAAAAAGAMTALEGSLVSLLAGPRGASSLAVVRLLQEDAMAEPATLTAVGAGVGGEENGSVPLVGDEQEKDVDRVELADALFGAAEPRLSQQNHANHLACAAVGDLMGRTVAFSDSSTGTVVAHRHPMAFVLRDSPPSTADPGLGKRCIVSAERMAIDPAAVPPGSTVNYLGQHVAVQGDGSVGRTLPKAFQQIAAATAADTSGVGINISSQKRPIFMPIPTVSQIGLIDSPLVTGITAIDALTPIGKGQNMLLIGQEEKGTETTRGVNKRGWVINLIRNVVENYTHHREGGVPMRCFYAVTSGDSRVRANVRDRIAAAGIQDDVTTVTSGFGADPGGMPLAEEDPTHANAVEAAEAVAVAAAACTLGEHHALATGGDSLVVVDDLNLHKVLWDVTTRELVQAYGVDAVVAADRQGGSSSEMRGFFSNLIQRAARFKNAKGGGSVTLLLLSTLPGDEAMEEEEGDLAFEAADFDAMSTAIQNRIATLVKARVPLTPTNLARIQIPIPRPSATEDARRLALQHVDDLISMSDGQIWLDAKLAEQGRSPPLDPSRSITRVGVGADTPCRADAPALRSVAGSLRFEFQQAMDVLDSSALSSSAVSTSAAEDAAKQVLRRDAFLLAMHQDASEVRRLSQECVLLFAAARGYLDGVLALGGEAGTQKGQKTIERMLNFAEEEIGSIMLSIDETLDLSLEHSAALEGMLSTYFAK